MPKGETDVMDSTHTDYEEIRDHSCVLIVEDDDDLRQFVRSILESDYEVHEASNGKEIAFIESINTFIKEHVGNNDFVIEDLAVEMGMSRTVFFKKLKGLTGLAPIEYIRDMLMQHAADLLENEDYSIKEVSYRVGMNDPKYFSKCFKKKFNMTPSEYKKYYANTGT